MEFILERGRNVDVIYVHVCVLTEVILKVLVCTKKLEKLDIWEWKLVVFQAILDLKVLNPLINKPRFRLECLGLILKVIL